MGDTTTAALIAFGGVAMGLLGRDVVMSLVLFRLKNTNEKNDRLKADARKRYDLVRLYADPLYESTRTFLFRINEIFSGKDRYFRINAPKIPFIEYKRISTLYRLASLLGWIRAFRRERAYLDPEDIIDFDFVNDPIAVIEKALADGQHIEQRRIDELVHLWQIPDSFVCDASTRDRLGSKIDHLRQDILSKAGCLAPADLDFKKQIELTSSCAKIICDAIGIEVPYSRVSDSIQQALPILGITEAYIYRDWQAAIGDLMIIEVNNGPRRFDVIGFGLFEERYLRARADAGHPERRWFDRLETLFHDFDMQNESMFDARRTQLKNLSEGCMTLEKYLKAKVEELRKSSAN